MFWAIVWYCLHDPTFCRLSRTPTCDRQMDGHTMIANTENRSQKANNDQQECDDIKVGIRVDNYKEIKRTAKHRQK